MLLQIRDLHVSYGQVGALLGVSMEIHEGQIVSIIGSNGAGKTTLLNAISRVVPSKKGEIHYKGQPLIRQAHLVVGEGIVHVPEGRKVFSGLSVYDNLRAGAYLNKDKEETMKMIDTMFELFPILAERRNQFAATLSGGEQQMLAIARGLMSKPTLLLLDEPSLGLAPKIVANVFSIIERIREKGITILLVEQNANKAIAISDYCYVLENGRIAYQGTGQEIRSNEAVTSAYLGKNRKADK